MIKIHKEGRVILSITLLITLLIIAAAFRFLPYQLSYIITTISIVVIALVLRFFRVPSRRLFLDEKTVTAPCDGKVVVIENLNHEAEYLDGPALQVSIFMSIHDVHINFFPIDGEIGYLKYHPGSYLLARHPKSSTLNERFSTGIETPFGNILIRQIAGYVARRIRCYATLGRRAKQGKELGFIKFGSRVDLFLPPDADVEVDLNQKVMGGVTPIARLK